jgi:hypothetical protein
LSAVLGLWALTYGSWVVGLALFLGLLALRRQWLYLPVPILFGFAAGRLQQLAMWLAGFGMVPDGQVAVLKIAITSHLSGLVNLNPAYLLSIGKFFLDFLFVDNPLILITALVGLLFYRGKAALILWAMLAVPLALLFIYQPPDSYIHGYAIPGVSAVLFPILGYWFAKAIDASRGNGLARVFVVVFAACVMLAQAAWSNAFRYGVALPTVAYFSGASNLCQPLTLQPTLYLDATGNPGRVPALFGGNAQLAEFTELKTGVTPPSRVEVVGIGSWVLSWIKAKPGALAVQSVILALIALILFSFLKYRPAKFVMIAILAVLFLPMRHRATDYQSVTHIWDYKQLQYGDRIDASMQLSPEFVSRLAAAAPPESTAQIYVNNIRRGGACLHLEALGETADAQPPWPWGDPRSATMISLPLPTMLARIAGANNRLDITLRYDGQTCGDQAAGIGGWRRVGPEYGRTARLTGTAGTQELDRFPAFEIRVLRPDSWTPVGFGPYSELRRRLPCVSVVGF